MRLMRMAHYRSVWRPLDKVYVQRWRGFGWYNDDDDHEIQRLKDCRHVISNSNMPWRRHRGPPRAILLPIAICLWNCRQSDSYQLIDTIKSALAAIPSLSRPLTPIKPHRHVIHLSQKMRRQQLTSHVVSGVVPWEITCLIARTQLVTIRSHLVNWCTRNFKLN